MARKLVVAALIGLAAVSTHGFGIAAEGGAPSVEITIRHSRFVPAVVDVEPGSTVRFVVRNTDPIDHELIVGDLAVQEAHERGTEAHHGAVPGEVSVAANETATTTYTFPTASRAPILLGCHLPGHWDYGMQALVRFR